MAVVYQRIGLDLHFSAIAKRLNLATSTAHRIYQQFERTGGVVSPPTICRLLRRYGMSRKRVRQVALQRSAILRGAFMAHCCLFSRDKFVWLDEMGADARDHVRKYGYAIRGMRPVTHRFINGCKSECYSSIVAGRHYSTRACIWISQRGVRSTLIPAMMPFDGINPRSILVMDNCSIHHVHEVRDVLLHAGIVTLFLPPYSPDMNPAEEAFSYVKGYLKKHDNFYKLEYHYNT